MKGHQLRLNTWLATVVMTGLPLLAAAQPPTQPPPAQPPVTQPPAPTPPQPPPQPPTPVPPTPVPPTTAPDPAAPAATPQAPSSDGAMVLLNRISELLEQSLGNPTSTKDEAKPKGTSGVKPTAASKSSAGKVSVDRAVLDEIHAEISQLKVMLAQPRKP